MPKYIFNLVPFTRESIGEEMSEFFDDNPEMVYSSENTPLHRLFVHVLDKLNETNGFGEVKFLRNEDEVEYYSLETEPSEDAEIDVVFIDNKDLVEWYNVNPEETVGIHCITSGPFEIVDGDVISHRNRVVVYLNEEYLKRFIAEERMMESDPNSDRHDIEYMMSYLNTVTHELAHAVEFIECTHGLTPSEAESIFCDSEYWSEMGAGLGVYTDPSKILETQKKLNDISLYAIGSKDENGTMLAYLHTKLREEESRFYQETEDRVENRGREVLESLPLDYELISFVAKHYAPKQEAELTESGKPKP